LFNYKLFSVHICQIPKADIVMDVGKSLYPATEVSQIEAGFVMVCVCCVMVILSFCCLDSCLWQLMLAGMVVWR